jgi:hypothetical protein
MRGCRVLVPIGADVDLREAHPVMTGEGRSSTPSSAIRTVEAWMADQVRHDVEESKHRAVGMTSVALNHPALSLRFIA